MTPRRLAGRLLAVALVLAAVLFLGRTIARNADALRAYDWSVDPGLLAASLLMAGTDNIREVIAFPKTATASDLLTGAPSPADDKQLKELGIRVKSVAPG